MKERELTTLPKWQNTETDLTLPVRSDALSERLGEGICRSMNSLSRVADKLTNSMEEANEYGEICGYAEALVKTVEAQANVVKTVAEAMNILGKKE